MINGVQLKPLKVFRDERGQLMQMMRCDDALFRQFGEVYFSVINAGVIKGWNRHARMTQNFAVPRGDIRLVIYDDRPESSTKGEVQELFIGERNYALVCVPPMVWYGFACDGPQAAMIANCASLPHDPQEMERRGLSDPSIPYQWGLKSQ